MAVVGLLGSLLLALCGLPLVLTAIRTKKSNDNLSFLLLWFFGEIFSVFYALTNVGFSWPLLLNYGFNIIFITIVLYYRLK